MHVTSANMFSVVLELHILDHERLPEFESIV